MSFMRAFEAPKTDLKAEKIAGLAVAAENLAPSLDLRRSPDAHIYAALDRAGITDAGQRRSLIPAIKKELHRRRPTPLSERQDIIADARRAEELHPKEDDEA